MIITLVHPYPNLSLSMMLQPFEKHITIKDSTFIDELAIKNI